MDFLFKNCTFLRKSKRITIPDLSYCNLLEKKLKNFKEPDNCDPVSAVYLNRHGENLGLVFGAYSSISLDTDSVEGKGKRYRAFVL